MCGIAGVLGARTNRTAVCLEAMVAAQTHRGPDDSGLQVIDLGEQRLALGQRRLAILDLSPLGRQPMEHPETGDVLVYNGELYNFKMIRRRLEAEGVRFRGHSDTEVMLHALVHWGPKIVSEFCGMFALAWYRKSNRTLVLARDPVGIKPLYVARTPGALLFASEVRAILASGLVPAQINRRGLAGMLAYGAVQEPETMIEGIRSFPSGCIQEIPLETALVREPPAPVRYWHPPVANPSISTAQAAEEVRPLLDEAVREHLVSDVPVGIFLSSGIDSTVIAALAARHAPKLMTYTVGLSEDAALSESALAARTAARLGLPHTEVQITAREAVGAARAWLDALDQPSVDGLNTYIVSGAVRRAGATVALSGLGGDEIFCGYGTFETVPRAYRFMKHFRRLPVSWRQAAARIISRGRNEAVRSKLTDMFMSDGDLLDMYFLRRRTLSTPQLRALGLESEELGLDSHFMPADALAGIDISRRYPYAAVSILETRFYAGNMVLRDSDITGMAHSLEIRVPMFDTRVLNYAMSLTARARMPRKRANKQILRSAFEDLIGQEILARPKSGFGLPIKTWMQTSLRDECETALNTLKSMNVVRRDGVDSVWKSFIQQPESPAWSRAFSLFVLGHYLSRLGAVSAPRDRNQDHWRRTPSSNGTEGAKSSSDALRSRSA